jgi:hypothetical protein
MFNHATPPAIVGPDIHELRFIRQRIGIQCTGAHQRLIGDHADRLALDSCK